MPQKNSNLQQTGFMLPMIIVLFGATTVILLAIFQQVISINSFSGDIIYRQVALTAARSALDYGKERFDGNQSFDTIVTPATDDTNNNSIPDALEEKPLFDNGKYRTTFQLSVVSGGTSLDGRAKKIVGIGKVYIPSTSTTPRFIRNINGEIIRSQIVASNPSDFSPLAWYDASCNSGFTLTAEDATNGDCMNNTVLKTGTDSAAANPSSMREENATGGANCGGAPNTGDGMLSFNFNSECGATTNQEVGLNFAIPAAKALKGKTITNAYIQFTSAAKDSGNASITIRGFKVNNKANFTAGGSNEINGPYTTASVTWAPGNWLSVGQSGTTQRTPDLSPIIQEIINQSGWTDGNRIAFAMFYDSGPKPRRAQLSPITLNLSFNTFVPAVSGETISVWRDRSGNGFHLNSLNTSSAKPTRSTITQPPTSGPAAAPNGKPMVSFGVGDGMRADVPSTTGRVGSGYTMISIIRVLNGTDTVNGNGYMVAMYGTGTGNEILSPMWRHPANGYHTFDDTDAGTPNTNSICIARDKSERGCVSVNPGNVNWVVYSARESSVIRDTLLRRSGGPFSFGQAQFQPAISINAPYRIVLGANPNSLSRETEADYAEVILYDRQLTCPQIESVEQYLSNKWGFTDTRLFDFNEYKSEGCAENNVPAY